MVTRAVGDTIGWVTVYDLLDENGNPVFQETQNWTMYEADSAVVLDLILDRQGHQRHCCQRI